MAVEKGFGAVRTERLYANPIVGRTGLANMLFAWARAEVFCRDHGALLLAPQWVNVLRVGPWLRRERDKRYYLANFSNAGMIQGLRRFAVLKAFRHLDEAEYSRDAQTGEKGVRVVDFRGMERFFEPFLTAQPYVKERLFAIASAPILEQLEQLPEEPFIGVHIRRGDFTTGGIATPDDWYVRAVAQALRAVGGDRRSLPIRVFSDADPESLRFLSEAFPRVVLTPKAPALLDLLQLSRCAALVGTSRSSFSMWAAFLGQMTSYWHPVEMPPALAVTPEASVIRVD